MSGSKCIYMEYRVRGGTWQTSGKMTNYLTTYKIDGLRSNTNYEARVYFGYWDTKGRFYRGPYSGIINFKTGQAKRLKIKSVKVKAVKVRKHRATYYGWYTGLPLGKYKYYTYKVKVTIKLKKKPGAKGIWINSKKLKGNKKKYTATFGTFSSYTKPKGKKFQIYAYSYSDGTVGGYSPMYSKKKKIK